MTPTKKAGTDEVIANISQVADNLTEQVASLREFVRLLQQEHEHSGEGPEEDVSQR